MMLGETNDSRDKAGVGGCEHEAVSLLALNYLQRWQLGQVDKREVGENANLVVAEVPASHMKVR